MLYPSSTESILCPCPLSSPGPLGASEGSGTTRHSAHPIPLLKLPFRAWLNPVLCPGHPLCPSAERGGGSGAWEEAAGQSSDPLGPRLRFSRVLWDTKGKQKARLPHLLPLPLPLQPARWADRLGGGEKGKKGRLCKGKHKRQRRQETGNGERLGETGGGETQ